MITIVGLGPGDPGDLTVRAAECLKGASRLYLRTEIHPTVSALQRWGIPFESFDRLYQEGATFEDVYAEIVRRLLAEGRSADVVYAVPGHPLVGEEAVRRLLSQGEVPVEVVSGVSSLDVLFGRLNLDPADGLQVVDALELARFEPGPGLPPLLEDRHTVVLQVFSPQRASETKIALMAMFADEHPVTVVRGAGVPDQERIETVPLLAVDRLAWIDHLTSFYLPPAPLRGARRLVALMHRLRAPGGCPWDREQTHESLRRFCLEEAYEVVDAIDQKDDDALEEELGDLLLQVVFHAELGSEDGRFTFAEIADRICDKLVARHPHVFGQEPEARTSAEHLARWEELKAKEKPADASAIAGVPLALPALTASEKLQARAARAGFEWPTWNGAVDKWLEEMAELMKEFERAQAATPWEDAALKAAVNHEMGDVITALVNLARFWKIDPEQSLRDANARFKRRFEAMERQSGGSIRGQSLEAMLALWSRAKAEVG